MVLETEQYYGTIWKELAEEMKKKLPIYRLTGKGRFYFTRETPVSNSRIYNSGTTLIGNYKDDQGELAIHRWKVGLINAGKDPAVELAMRQDYGTLLHITYGDLLNGVELDYNNLDDYVLGLSEVTNFTKERLLHVYNTTKDEFSKDLASFTQWVHDYKVRPIGVELMLKSDKWKVATALDLVHYATVEEEGEWGEVYKSGPRKGQPKLSKKPVEKLLITDFKSGKKGFYDKNVLQLLLSRDIFEENFPGLKIEGVFNFAPNDWTNKPTYKFHDQERVTKKIDYLKRIKQNVFERGVSEFEELLLKKKRRMFSGVVSTNTGYQNPVYYLGNVELANHHYDLHHLRKSEEVKKVVSQYKRAELLGLSNKELVGIADLAGVAVNDRDSFLNVLVRV